MRVQCACQSGRASRLPYRNAERAAPTRRAYTTRNATLGHSQRLQLAREIDGPKQSEAKRTPNESSSPSRAPPDSIGMAPASSNRHGQERNHRENDFGRYAGRLHDDRDIVYGGDSADPKADDSPELSLHTSRTRPIVDVDACLRGPSAGRVATRLSRQRERTRAGRDPE